MSVNFTLGNLFTVSAYLAPIHADGPLCLWANRSEVWRHGFVFRLLWLGLVMRFNKVPYFERPSVQRQWKLQNMIEQANDGDYVSHFLGDSD